MLPKVTTAEIISKSNQEFVGFQKGPPKSQLDRTDTRKSLSLSLKHVMWNKTELYSTYCLVLFCFCRDFAKLSSDKGLESHRALGTVQVVLIICMGILTIHYRWSPIQRHPLLFMGKHTCFRAKKKRPSRHYSNRLLNTQNCTVFPLQREFQVSRQLQHTMYHSYSKKLFSCPYKFTIVSCRHCWRETRIFIIIVMILVSVSIDILMPWIVFQKEDVWEELIISVTTQGTLVVEELSRRN